MTLAPGAAHRGRGRSSAAPQRHPGKKRHRKVDWQRIRLWGRAGLLTPVHMQFCMERRMLPPVEDSYCLQCWPGARRRLDREMPRERQTAAVCAAGCRRKVSSEAELPKSQLINGPAAAQLPCRRSGTRRLRGGICHTVMMMIIRPAPTAGGVERFRVFKMLEPPQVPHPSDLPNPPPSLQKPRTKPNARRGRRPCRTNKRLDAIRSNPRRQKLEMMLREHEYMTEGISRLSSRIMVMPTQRPSPPVMLKKCAAS